MKSIVKQVRISSKKASLVAGCVRNMEALKALELLNSMNKKAAVIISKLLKSAVANAEHNFGQKKENLVIAKLFVTEGPTYKRGQSHSRGRVTPLFKRTSNITVELESSRDLDNKAEEVDKKVE